MALDLTAGTTGLLFPPEAGYRLSSRRVLSERQVFDFCECPGRPRTLRHVRL